jgi:ParB-like chromosome segregation protein Spo0J
VTNTKGTRPNKMQFFAGNAPPKSLHPNQRVNPRVVTEISSSMQEHGYTGTPLDVMHLGGSLEVTDGHHRRAAAVKAGLPSVPVMGASSAGIPKGMREISEREYHQTLNPALARVLYPDI